MESVSSSALPPKGSDYIFSVSKSVLIDAPRDKVWSILMDFPSYTEWNPFMPSLRLTDASKLPLSDQTPSEGKHISMQVNLPPKLGEPGASSALVVIENLDHENYRVVWTTADHPYFLLHAKRWQSLSVDEDTGKTKFENFEVFSGIFAYLVRFFVGAKLRLAFEAVADALKKRAEEN